MARLSKAQREQKQIERLQQQLIILNSKISVLMQAKTTVVEKLAILQI